MSFLKHLLCLHSGWVSCCGRKEKFIALWVRWQCITPYCSISISDGTNLILRDFFLIVIYVVKVDSGWLLLSCLRFSHHGTCSQGVCWSVAQDRFKCREHRLSFHSAWFIFNKILKVHRVCVLVWKIAYNQIFGSSSVPILKGAYGRVRGVSWFYKWSQSTVLNSFYAN